ncbi:MAG TPA: hypothetical protein PKY73_16405, partial [Hyphomonas sp.]|nr:hypothetical protein [Hyphomonas sp.]
RRTAALALEREAVRPDAYGGSATVRTAPYLAARNASRHSATFKAFRQKQQEAGKPVKAALTTAARKPFRVLNSMVADGTYIREVQPT